MKSKANKNKAAMPVGSGVLLGHWCIRIWRTMMCRAFPKHRMDAHAAWWHGRHNRMMGALIAIRERLKSSGDALPQHASELMESASNNLEIFKLRAQLTILYLENRKLRFKFYILVCERRHLLFQQSYVRALNGRRPVFGYQFLYAIKWLHILCSAKWPNDPKLSHGANNCKREFAANLQMKEQPPLAPARC
jgi:hypothetical protein